MWWQENLSGKKQIKNILPSSRAKYLTSLFISVSGKILPDYSDWSKQINSRTSHSSQELIMLMLTHSWGHILFNTNFIWFYNKFLIFPQCFASTTKFQKVIQKRNISSSFVSEENGGQLSKWLLPTPTHILKWCYAELRNVKVTVWSQWEPLWWKWRYDRQRWSYQAMGRQGDRDG